MSDFMVQHSVVDNMSDEMRALTSTMIEALDTLIHQLQPMVASWTGAGQAAWQQVQSTWMNKTNDMQAQFGHAHATLDVVHDHYIKTDRAIAMHMQSL